MPFKVLVDDNFHYMDEDERYTLGTFDTLEEAIDAAKRIVDEWLEHAHEPGMSSAELMTAYIGFGEDPFIVSPDISGVAFSARDYARSQCELICAQSDPGR